MFSDNEAMEGVGTHISDRHAQIKRRFKNICGNRVNIRISQTSFRQNTAIISGGGMDIICFMNTVGHFSSPSLINITCLNCNFNANKVENGYAVSNTCRLDSEMYLNLLDLNNGVQTYNKDHCAAVFCKPCLTGSVFEI